MNYTSIILPVRPQIDTIIAVFLLRTFGKEKFPGIENAKVGFWHEVPHGENKKTLMEKGVILIDIGGGEFDHHEKNSTASDLVAKHLGIDNLPELSKLLEFAKRDDKFGKGIISNDPLDRAFGLPGLVANLVRRYSHEPWYVVEITLPFIEAHHHEEVMRAHAFPGELKDRLRDGTAESFEVKQRDKKLKVILIQSDTVGIIGFLRSQLGGAHDVVAQINSSGYVNILTRPTKRVDLRALTLMVRLEEAQAKNTEFNGDEKYLTHEGRIKEVPEWYFDPVTNSLQNGGINPSGISPTQILRSEWKRILHAGLSEMILKRGGQR